MAPPVLPEGSGLPHAARRPSQAARTRWQRLGRPSQEAVKRAISPLPPTGVCRLPRHTAAAAQLVEEYANRLLLDPGPDTMVIHCSASCSDSTCCPAWHVVHVKPHLLTFVAWGQTLPPWLVKFLSENHSTDEQERKRFQATADGRMPPYAGVGPGGLTAGGRCG